MTWALSEADVRTVHIILDRGIYENDAEISRRMLNKQDYCKTCGYGIYWNWSPAV